ncbi:MAG TPA: hypothetical protein VL137_01330 [Polyangiaceae bacterium]|nr:hypothetical protein [Polyangiaceae bacterium]
MMLRLAALSSCAVLLACSQGEESTRGQNELFRVRDAEFVAGALPGYKAPTTPTTTPNTHGLPTITNISLANFIVRQGQGGKRIAGQASDKSWSIGVSLKGISNGYWMLPVGDVDPSTGAFGWSGVADFDPGVPTGPQTLQMVVFDRQGRAGVQALQNLCVAGIEPDEFNVCYPNTPPPAAAISLTWNANADLDLQVVTPDGKVVSAKHPLVADPQGDEIVDPSEPHLDRDSGANCTPEGIHTENLIWPNDAPVGRYRIHVNLFNPCGRSIVPFRVAVFTSTAVGDAGREMKRSFESSGEILDVQAGPASALGMLITNYNFK